MTETVLKAILSPASFSTSKLDDANTSRLWNIQRLHILHFQSHVVIQNGKQKSINAANYLMVKAAAAAIESNLHNLADHTANPSFLPVVDLQFLPTRLYVQQRLLELTG